MDCRVQTKFCPELSAAIDRKTRTDAALLRLRLDMCAGTIPYSMSAILSAMENCDDAMEAVWLEAGRVVHEESNPVSKNVYSRTNNRPLYGMLFNNAIVSITQKRIRQFFTKAPKAIRPHQNTV